jgi:hypothetical protein
LPPNFFAAFPNAQNIDISSNELSGTFPTNIPLLPQLSVFLASNNSFVGPLPTNIWATQLDYSYNQCQWHGLVLGCNCVGPAVQWDVNVEPFRLPVCVSVSGPVSFSQSSQQVNTVNVLNLAFAGHFDCNFDLIGLDPHASGSLHTLNVRGSINSGCNINDKSQINLPIMQSLDISDISWQSIQLQPWMLRLPTLYAVRANVVAMVDIYAAGFVPPIETLVLDGSNWAAQYGGVSQFAQWSHFLSQSTSLSTLSCNGCNLQFSFEALCDSMPHAGGSGGTLTQLFLSSNNLQGVSYKKRV